MSKCKSLIEAETEVQRWRRVARRRRLDAEAQAEELIRVQRRLERVKTLREEEREISEAYSNSAEKEINKLSDELEQAAKTIKELSARNLTIPSEHSFAEHEAYEKAKAKIEALEVAVHDFALEQNNLEQAVGDIVGYSGDSFDGCDVLAEVTALKHNYDNAMEVLAATTRQRDQLRIELDKAVQQISEMQKVLAPKVYPQ
jgi:chromosome segregation ATPase